MGSTCGCVSTRFGQSGYILNLSAHIRVKDWILMSEILVLDNQSLVHCY